MILIDKDRDIQTLVLTLSENSEGLSGDYILNLTSDGNRGEFIFILPANESNFKERFDLFTIETGAFDELSDGLYSYSVNLNDVIVETGKALVKSTLEPSEIIIQPNSSTNKILMYGE